MALLFLVVNLAGVVVAAAWREPLHAGLHAGLVLLAACLVWRLLPGRDARRLWRRGGTEAPAVVPELTGRLAVLEQSVDTVAVEVERIGEGQRYMTRLFTEAGTPRAPGEGAPESGEARTREPAPQVHRS